MAATQLQEVYLLAGLMLDCLLGLLTVTILPNLLASYAL